MVVFLEQFLKRKFGFHQVSFSYSQNMLMLSDSRGVPVICVLFFDFDFLTTLVNQEHLHSRIRIWLSTLGLQPRPQGLLLNDFQDGGSSS